MIFSKYCYSENVGLLGLTHIGSRRVVQISTAFMFFFSIFGLFFTSCRHYFEEFRVAFSCLIILRCVFSGKFGAFFASIPLPIFAAIYCVLFGIVGEWRCWWHYGPIRSFFLLSFFCVSSYEHVLYTYEFARNVVFFPAKQPKHSHTSSQTPELNAYRRIFYLFIYLLRITSTPAHTTKISLRKLKKTEMDRLEYWRTPENS